MDTLYSFRRCPYAMRARLAIAASGRRVALREIVLRDKPDAMLEASPKGTVPVLVKEDGSMIEESLDIMIWALQGHDPEGWLDDEVPAMMSLIAHQDENFKPALDRYKYPNRYDDATDTARDTAALFVHMLELRLSTTPYLFGAHFTFADGAIAPFIRQFAHVDTDWFYSQDWPHVITWLDAFKASDRFAAIMAKYPKWEPGDPATLFPSEV